jgi:hypothetical protein
MAVRRYSPISLNPTYNRFFDILKSASPVLAGQKGPPNASSLNLNDLQSLKYQLYLRTGDKDGMIPKKGTHVPALLKEAENLIKEINGEFVITQQTAVNHGRPAPKEMPKEMKHRLWKAEAKEDIVKSEIETLERWIGDIESKKAVVDDGKVLQHGPQGNGVLRGGILYELDGQRVAVDKKGELFINDDRSKYNKMKTADYLSLIVVPWKKENAKIARAFLEQQRKGIIKDTTRRPPKAPWPEPPKKKEEK